MRRALIAGFLLTVLLSSRTVHSADRKKNLDPAFNTSDRCIACHVGMSTPTGQDVSLGLQWRASVMANAARDPYWQGSVRRETIDHPDAKADIEDECSVCHMPITHYEAKIRGRKGEVFAYLPFDKKADRSAEAKDGVSCSVCHQITKEKLGTRESFNGGFVVQSPANGNDRPEYGPFPISEGNQHIMQSSTGGFRPTEAEHIRDSALCGSCHQLYTTARGAGGKAIGSLPEQMPYLEWLHSNYPARYSCQECHMTEVKEATPVSAVLGVPRTGVHEHVFVGGNFLLQRMLNRYGHELDVAALPEELSTAAEGTLAFLQARAARISIRRLDIDSSQLRAEVFVENLTGHKLPTAYPSRRAWIHFAITDRNGKRVFESGALNPDGSIVSNDNDDNPERFEPHYREITSSDQVQVYEDILGDPQGAVTTGLLTAVKYLKDNRLLPAGFDKSNADPEIRVVGDAADDPAFTAGGDLVRFSVPIGQAEGPFHIEVELLYQPIGFRWANNLEPYKAFEPERFVRYYNEMSTGTATVLARAEANK